jgi:hypothetical protein
MWEETGDHIQSPRYRLDCLFPRYYPGIDCYHDSGVVEIAWVLLGDSPGWLTSFDFSMCHAWEVDKCTLQPASSI